MRAENGDIPRWAVRVLVAALVGMLSALTYWVRDLPALPARVAAIESAHAELREEIRAGFRDVAQRIDRLIERQRRDGR